MAYLATYLTTAAAFLIVDAIWLRQVMAPMFYREVGPLLRDEIDLLPAALFYAAYVVGILYFCSLPGLRADSAWLAVGNGAALGFLAYGTYEATNLATLKGWKWSMAAVDTTWGIALTAFAAFVGWWVGGRMGLG